MAIYKNNGEVKPRWNMGRGAQIRIDWDKGNTHLNVCGEAEKMHLCLDL